MFCLSVSSFRASHHLPAALHVWHALEQVQATYQQIEKECSVMINKAGINLAEILLSFLQTADCRVGTRAQRALVGYQGCALEGDTEKGKREESIGGRCLYEIDCLELRHDPEMTSIQGQRGQIMKC